MLIRFTPPLFRIVFLSNGYPCRLLALCNIMATFTSFYVLKNECRSAFALTHRGHEVNMCSSVDKR